MKSEDLDAGESLVARVRAHARSTPERPAVEARGETLTYRELDLRVEMLAARLAPHLPGPGLPVGVCLERTVDLPAWLLAIFRLGCAYVPLDPSLPEARLALILDNAAPPVVVVSGTLRDRLPPFPGRTIVADDPAPPMVVFPAASVAASASDLAYIMYTSGSTGQPKGVEIEHRSVLALLAAIALAPGLRAGGTLLAITRIGFDLSVIDLFLPLYVGARTVILSLEDAADPQALSDAIARHAPDLMQATPATWRALLESGWSGAPTLTLLCGGEAMGRDLADRLLPRCRELWNVYGPTETTVWSTAHHVAADAGAVPIGWPIAGTTVRIADDTLRELPHGETGEIVISGAGLARGYRGARALSAERFVTLDDGARGYRTGDLGRVGGDGLLYCLGRRDDQVKVRGFRIELGDVESAIAAHPHVAWCAARIWPGSGGDTTLVAYVVAAGGGALPARDLKAFLATILPPYMIPDRIVPMAEMPLTANGKVDRKALPNPVERRAEAPRPLADDAERRMATIWSDLLGVPVARVDDDFFDLGGYSLITVRLIRRIAEAFGRDLEIADLMRASTLGAMTAVATGGDLTPATPVMPLNGAGTRPPLHWADAGPLIRTLALSMPAQQAVHSLNLTGADERRLASEPLTITEVAAALRDHLRAVQPAGPYYLGGWCRWGIVAQELACQLRAEGAEVALLVLLDADVPAPRRGTSAARAGLRRLLRPAPPPPEAAESFSQAVEAACHRHRPRVFDGDVLLIRPATPSSRGTEPAWRRLTLGQLAVLRTSGDHETMIRRPHVEALGAQISERLLRAQRTRAATPPAPVTPDPIRTPPPLTAASVLVGGSA